MSQQALFKLANLLDYSMCVCVSTFNQVAYQPANCCCVLALQWSCGQYYSTAVTGAADRETRYVRESLYLQSDFILILIVLQ